MKRAPPKSRLSYVELNAFTTSLMHRLPLGTRLLAFLCSTFTAGSLWHMLCPEFIPYSTQHDGWVR